MNRLLKKAIFLAAAAVIVTSATTAVYAHGPVYKIEKASRYGIRISLSLQEEGKNIPVWIKDIKLGTGEDGKLAEVYYTRQSVESLKAYIDLDSRIFNLPIRVNLISADAPEEEIFSDLSNRKQIEYIAHLHDAGIVGGYPDKTYHPAESITRAEFMAMMIKALKLEGSTSDAEEYSDIENHWAKPILLLAVKHGLLKGYDGNLLKPDAPITIGEASTIISKSFSIDDKISGNFEENNSSYTGHWAWQYMKKLLYSGIISANNDSEIEHDKFETLNDITAQYGFLNTNPDTPIARGDCAVLLSRAITHK